MFLEHHFLLGLYENVRICDLKKIIRNYKAS